MRIWYVKHEDIDAQRKGPHTVQAPTAGHAARQAFQGVDEVATSSGDFDVRGVAYDVAGERLGVVGLYDFEEVDNAPGQVDSGPWTCVDCLFTMHTLDVRDSHRCAEGLANGAPPRDDW